MALRDKIAKARKLDKELYEKAKLGIKKGVKRYKSDPMLWALITVEVVLIMLVIFAFVFLFDPNLDFLDLLSKSIGITEISDPIPWEIKFVLFLATLFMVYKLYGYTEWYRKKINQ